MSRAAVRWAVISLVLGPAGLGILWLGLARHAPVTLPAAPSDEQRLAYDGPLRNIRPDVHYVGDVVCAECHVNQTDSYRNSAMGRSLAPIARLAPAQQYGPEVHNPFEAFACRLEVVRDGERVWHRQVLSNGDGQPLLVNAMEIDYAIGSGHRGHSYLTAEEGSVFQSPVSWYAQKGIWDASPGFASGMRRPIVADCLFCHGNRVEPVAHTINRYYEPIFRGHAIGCERCHGPGELHVRAHETGETTVGTIVNPRKLPKQLREDVCQQCHLQGEGRVERSGRSAWDFRPGLPLREYWSIFVPADEPTGERPAVSQVEQMYSSRCFQASAGELGCISCHDPHRHIDNKECDAFYRRKCLTCHNQRGCNLPLVTRQAKQDSCVDCHMPRLPTADIVHTAMNDHRILRAPGRAAAQATKSFPFRAPVRLFRADELTDAQLNSPRELGLVLVQIARDKGRLRDELPLAVGLIERALVDNPRDIALWEHKGTALVLRRDRLPEALAAFETVLQLCPDHEVALSQAAFVTQLMEKYEEALPYWRRAVAISPRQENYRFNLAMTLSRLRRWPEALDACREAVRLDPFSGRNRVLLAVCLHHNGEQEQARAEFEKVRSLKPPDFDGLKRQFEEGTQ
jgi:predicted CXXCH cytochrome family protein